MKKLWLIPILILTACSSFQKNQYATAQAAVDAVEAARITYYDLRVKCQANPAFLPFCTKLVAAHDGLQQKYITYQAALQAWAAANVAAMNAANDPTLQQKVADALAGLVAIVQDFMAYQAAVTSKGAP